MTSPRVKGAKYENLAKKCLEKKGFNVFRVAGSIKWSKSVDIFGLFDLFAVRKGKFKLVQVKLNRKPPIQPFEEFWEENKGEHLSVEIWTFWGKGKRKNKQGWERIIWRM